MGEIHKFELKSIEDALLYAENIIETVRDSLIVIDFNLKVVSANKSFYQTFEVNSKETIGHYIYDLGNKQWNIPKLRFLLDDILQNNTKIVDYEIEHNFESIGGKIMLLNARRIDHVQLILLEITDITKNKEIENRMLSMLREKEILLKEVHHRIKNNMMVVSGLLMLQVSYMKDPSAINALNDAQSRLQNMSLLYEKLYRSDNYSEISLKEYLEKLIDSVFLNFLKINHISVIKHIDDIIISAQKSFSVGIIINELLTNIMKYAFKNRDKGTVTLSVSEIKNRVVIVLQDDGVGLPEGVCLKENKTFGMNLVGMMTEQINGIMKIEREDGTKFTLEFEDKQ